LKRVSSSSFLNQCADVDLDLAQGAELFRGVKRLQRADLTATVNVCENLEPITASPVNPLGKLSEFAKDAWWLNIGLAVKRARPCSTICLHRDPAHTGRYSAVLGF
jgi:hypothetical protein